MAHYTNPGEKIWRQIVQNLIRSYPYKIFCTILSQDPTISFVFVSLEISSDSDCKMSAQNLTRFKNQETYRDELNDSWQILPDHIRFVKKENIQQYLVQILSVLICSCMIWRVFFSREKSWLHCCYYQEI